MTPRISLLLGLCLLTASSACSTPASPQSSVSPSDADEPGPRGRPFRTPVLELSHHGELGSPYYEVDAYVPEFILYEDGLVIYVEGEGKDARIRQAHLPADEVYTMLDHARDQLAAVPEPIVASTATDQPQASITLFHENQRTTVDAYGVDRQGASTDAEVVIPAPFVALYRELQDFGHADAEPWQPDELEIVLWNKDHVREAAAPWPEAVPLPPADARQPRPFHRPRGKAGYPRPIVFRVDGDAEATIGAALAELGETTPVEWNGHKWLVRARRVLPNTPWS